MNSVERINNAIASLTRATDTSNAPPGTKKAVGDLGAHWARYWHSSTRAFVPGFLEHDRLGRYVQWYARAWILVPASVRAQAPAPEQIDPAFEELASDTLAQHLDSLQQTAGDAKAMTRWVAEQTVSLGREIKTTSAELGKWVLFAGGLTVLGLYFYRRPARRR